MGPNFGYFPPFRYVLQGKHFSDGSGLKMVVTASRWVDPALGFAVGWVSVFLILLMSKFLILASELLLYQCVSSGVNLVSSPARLTQHSITIPTEISATVVLLTFWDQNVLFLSNLMPSCFLLDVVIGKSCCNIYCGKHQI